MDYHLYFVQVPDLHGVIAVMEELGGTYIGPTAGDHRFVFSGRFVIGYRHETSAIGCQAEAVLTKSYSYPQERFVKQLQRLFRRLPGFAYCPSSSEEIHLVRGSVDTDLWGVRPSLQSIIGGVTYHVHKEDDTGMATLWGRPPEGVRGVPIGKVVPDITEPELAVVLIQHAALA